MRCGLLGERLGHSYSPGIHAMLGDYAYDLFEKKPEELADFLQNGDFTGLNVTIPYKKAVIPYCTVLTDRAKALGAVNTLVRRPDGQLVGHNTDYFGFETMLRSSGLSVAGKKALVLGSGGASNTVCAVLTAAGAQAVVISRSGENNYQNLDRHADAAILVNATPVGMYPDTLVSPVELSRLPRLEGVLDLIYNPARTKLLLDARTRGLVAVNGLGMLVAQAWESAKWFTGSAIASEKIREIHTALRQKTENLILIGMPGSGKTTVGRILAEKTGRRFADADELVRERAGCSIAEIFTVRGEAGFRALETEALRTLGKQSGLVIATGGGCVTRAENDPVLRQNGTVFCLERALEKLAVEGRPLSQSTPVEQMYQARKPLYARFADHFVDNNGDAQSCAKEILRIWRETP